MTEHGADAMNKRNKTALMRACAKGHIRIINLLLSCGGDPNIADNDGDTSLHIALTVLAKKFFRQILVMVLKWMQQRNGNKLRLD